MKESSRTNKNKKRAMTIIAIIMIGLLVCCSLGACGDTGDEESSASVSSSQEANKTAAQKKKAAIEKKRREAAKKKAEAAKKAKEEKAKDEEQKSGSAGSSSSAEKNSGSKDSGKSSAGSSKSKGSQKASNKKSGGKSSGNNGSSQGHSKKATCTISITCHKLVGNEDLSSAQRARVPSSGVIMSRTTVEIKSGDSVYDVLKRAAGEKGIVISAENTALGIYVDGIDGFYEKDAGAESGWKYKVNGSYPNDSAGDVKVRDGDVIEWVYVLTA